MKHLISPTIRHHNAIADLKRLRGQPQINALRLKWSLDDHMRTAIDNAKRK